MNTKTKTTHNEADKPQWWLRFARLFRRASRLKAPHWTGLRVHHDGLVVRHFPLSVGKTFHGAHK